MSGKHKGAQRGGGGKNVGPPPRNDDFISEFDIITRLISMQNKPGECMLGRFRRKPNQIFVLFRKIKGVIRIENVKTFFEILKLMFFSFLIKDFFFDIFLIYQTILYSNFIS